MDGYNRPTDISFVRDRLIAAQEGRCGICGAPFRIRTNLYRTWTVANIDHVLARALDGFDGPGNMIATHHRCNRQKQHRLPTGCEIIWLIAVCERLDVPVRLKAEMAWRAPEVRRVA